MMGMLLICLYFGKLDDGMTFIVFYTYIWVIWLLYDRHVVDMFILR